MIEKVFLAMVSAIAGGMFTYSTKAVSIEGRVDALERMPARLLVIEQGVARIEATLTARPRRGE